jgi:hypothetical protein
MLFFFRKITHLRSELKKNHPMKKIFFLCLGILMTNLVCQARTPLFTTQKSHNQVAAGDSLALMPYVGEYKFKENGFLEKVKVIFEKGDLYSEAEGYMKVKLSPDGTNADNFKTDAYDAQVIFIRDDKKEIVGLKLIVQGQELEADKVKQ